mmetsp:Transcript_31840/g.36575  ORF Transcript_31840/g.36575 Transcript_31840/m.36575 type:complete len:84 (+) Transcript_31840:135-386(+)
MITGKSDHEKLLIFVVGGGDNDNADDGSRRSPIPNQDDVAESNTDADVDTDVDVNDDVVMVSNRTGNSVIVVGDDNVDVILDP